MKLSKMKVRHGFIKFMRKITSPKAHSIYAGIGVAATAGVTGYSSWKACEKAAELKKEDPNITIAETAKAVAPYYIPSLAVTAGTIGLVAKSAKGYSRIINGLSHAYQARCQEAVEYKAMALGLPAAEVLHGYYDKPGTIVIEDGERVYYDIMSHRYFSAKPEAVKQAIIDLNEKFQETGYANLDDWYEALNIPSVEEGDVLCWDSEFMYDYFETYFIKFDDSDDKEMSDGELCTIIEPYIYPRYYDEKAEDWIEFEGVPAFLES